jgi:hypothetical protein
VFCVSTNSFGHPNNESDMNGGTECMGESRRTYRVLILGLNAVDGFDAATKGSRPFCCWD